MQNKIRIFNANVKAVLLYEAETWRTTLTTTKRVQTFVNSCLGVGGLKSSVINGSVVTTHITETLEMDWAHSPQTIRHHYTTSLKLESRGEKEGKQDDRETHSTANWKPTSNQLDTAGNILKDLRRTGMPGGIMLASYAS